MTTSDHYTYVLAPTVTGVSPSSGSLAGGASIIITGTNFSGASAVKFGGLNAMSFTVNSATQITAVDPGVSSPEMVDVTVTTTGGTSATSSKDQFTYAGVPTVTGVSPTSGLLAGGNSVTITGTNFTGASAVKFGNLNATSFTVNSATQITAVDPAATSAGAVHVTVTTAGGTSTTSNNDQFTYVTDGPLSAGTVTAAGGVEYTTATSLTATFTDANANAPTSYFSGTINWGDGAPGNPDITTFTSSAVTGSSGSYTVSGSHQYAEDGRIPSPWSSTTAAAARRPTPVQRQSPMRR